VVVERGMSGGGVDVVSGWYGGDGVDYTSSVGDTQSFIYM